MRGTGCPRAGRRYAGRRGGCGRALPSCSAGRRPDDKARGRGAPWKRPRGHARPSRALLGHHRGQAPCHCPRLVLGSDRGGQGPTRRGIISKRADFWGRWGRAAPVRMCLGRVTEGVASRCKRGLSATDRDGASQSRLNVTPSATERLTFQPSPRRATPCFCTTEYASGAHPRENRPRPSNPKGNASGRTYKATKDSTATKSNGRCH